MASIKVTPAQFAMFQRQQGGLDDGAAEMSAKQSRRRKTGKLLEDLVGESGAWYRQNDRAYIQRFEPEKRLIRGQLRTFGRGRPDWMGAYRGNGLLFETKNLTGHSASFALPKPSANADEAELKYIDGQRQQAESMLAFLRHGMGHTRAFYLLYDAEFIFESPREPGAMWCLEGETVLRRLLNGERLKVRERKDKETWSHYFPVCGPTPVRDLQRRSLRPPWDFLGLLSVFER